MKKSDRRSVVVTGMGLVSPLGCAVWTMWILRGLPAMWVG